MSLFGWCKQLLFGGGATSATPSTKPKDDESIKKNLALFMEADGIFDTKNIVFSLKDRHWYMGTADVTLDGKHYDFDGIWLCESKTEAPDPFLPIAWFPTEVAAKYFIKHILLKAVNLKTEGGDY